MELINPQVIDYLRKLHNVKDPVIDAMRRYSQDHDVPTIGTLGGQLCTQLALMIGAKSVFELGCSFGYSTLWFARALPDDGHVHFTQSNAEWIGVARDFLKRAGVLGKVAFHEGDPLESMLNTPGEFDIVLLNLGRRNLEALAPIHDRLRTGGLLITVNVLQQGRVLRLSDDDAVQNAQIFNHTLLRHPGFMTTVNPIRDGISVSLKLPT